MPLTVAIFRIPPLAPCQLPGSPARADNIQDGRLRQASLRWGVLRMGAHAHAVSDATQVCRRAEAIVRTGSLLWQRAMSVGTMSLTTEHCYRQLDSGDPLKIHTGFK